jgi:hypothetical protein
MVDRIVVIVSSNIFLKLGNVSRDGSQLTNKQRGGLFPRSFDAVVTQCTQIRAQQKNAAE